jgi:glycosyltransferase involved in cell wall biosynthesis
MRCKLSIIIPTYKRTASLTRLLNILKHQTLKQDIELIVIDQNEKGYLEREIGKDVLEGIRHFYQDEPNVSTARNYGVKSFSWILYIVYG